MPNELEILKDVDDAFIGVNMRLAPEKVPKGMVASAKNVRFDNGVISPRRGWKKVGWANQTNFQGDADSAERNVGFKPFLNVRGIGKFSDPNGINWILVAEASESGATNHNVWALTPGRDPIKINSSLDFGADAGVRVTFVQCFNIVVMLRGSDLEPLKMQRIDDGFVSIAQEDTDLTIEENEGRKIASDGTDQIPNSSQGIFFQNRLVLIFGRDNVAASDALNYTRYAPLRSQMRINQGSEDALVALHKFDQTTVICFKESSVYAVRNVYGDLSDIYLDELTRGFGLVGVRSVVSVGKDVWFLSDQRGIVSLQVHESGKLQGLDVPASDAIDPLIKRINWHYAKNAVAAYLGNKAFWAIPIDGSEKNNAIICFDFKNKSWAGYDTSTAWAKPGYCSVAGYTNKVMCERDGNGGGDGIWTDEVGVFDFITFKFGGAERLMLMTTEGYLGVYDDPILCDQGYDEDTTTATGTGRNSTYKQVDAEVVTRGYSFGSTDFKKYMQSNVSLATNNVVDSTNTKGISIVANVDGVEETQSVLSNLNFKREKYHKPFNKADYDITNVNNDNLSPDRQDYSIDPDTAFDPKDGFDPDRKQESLHKTRFNKRGSYMQFKVTNTQGVCDVKSIEVQGVPDGISVTTRR